MKPRFIFSAVGVICAVMIFTLPSLARVPRTGTASAAPVSSALGANAAAPTAAIQEMAAQPAPTLAALPAATLPAAATLPPIAVSEQQPPAAPADTIGSAAQPPAAETTQVPVIAGEVVDPFVNAGTAIANAAAAAPSIPLSAEPPELQAFTASVVNGQANTVVGFYVPNVLALPVLQQPGSDGNYISDQDGTVTQFAKPGQYGVTALLAHNFLSGRLFFQLKQGQELYMIYGDGSLLRYRIDSILSYQALSPYDPQSQFVDLNVAGAPVISHSDLFQRVYTTANQVVLQTCIEANGEPSWGRIFIIADPV